MLELQFCLQFWLLLCTRANGMRGVPEENRKTNYVRHIDRSLLGWVGNVEPYVGWSKGALTTTLLQFLEEFCRQRNLESSGDERVRLIATLAATIATIVFFPIYVFHVVFHINFGELR